MTRLDARAFIAIITLIGCFGMAILNRMLGKDLEIPTWAAVSIGMIISHYYNSRQAEDAKPKAGHGQEMETITTIKPCPAAQAGIERASYERAQTPTRVEVINKPDSPVPVTTTGEDK